MNSSSPIQIVDLFAGPGGLGEGFASFERGTRFNIIVSAEMDPVARKTLRLRAYYRLVKKEKPEFLEDYYNYCNGISAEPYSNRTKSYWEKSGNEARRITLGDPEDNKILDAIINEKLDRSKPWILIGGPPCQAYSLVGRSRNMGKVDYRAEDDHRHFLYLEYLRIIQKNKPAVFLMENVKGILSSKVNGESMFPKILKDLAAPDTALNKSDTGLRYKICSLVEHEDGTHDLIPNEIDPRNYIIRSEHYGIPQARHRVILLGILVQDNNEPFTFEKLKLEEQVTLDDILKNLPPLRSKLTKDTDTSDKWCLEILNQIDAIEAPSVARGRSDFVAELRNTRNAVGKYLSTGSLRYEKGIYQGITSKPALDDWYIDKNLGVWLNHEARGHMASDLRRYIYASVYAVVNGRAPKGHLEFDLPGLAPDHKNWESGKFCDRFKVQVKNSPSTTITSHISKDGHYFIHPDPTQCRSLTVREAARLQTFPDNYFFEGNRTQQFHQVGNAVPPMLAAKMAKIVSEIIG
ncbi:DNA (cytosine-5-)-methyltransferase [Pseudomonas fluorescens]|jgi:DNA (cytosine-5)-methyltransferase 1|uniref:DNA cytosine methyltransferase n=1 Tax=Pseudomonas TaxID=286 RepID=UPI000710C3DF|nr:MULTISPECIES: DNA cytosine methyltransferase [Pseudomonas]OOQ43478.1 DNA (cytosine-5-)-methyltransferase [Pseudomonas fluorescens]